MSPEQMRNFAERNAAMRDKLFGSVCQLDGKEIRAAVTAVTDRKQLEEGGFEYEHDAIARIDARHVAFTPKLGMSFVTARGQALVVREVREPGVSAEWRLGLEQV